MSTDRQHQRYLESLAKKGYTLHEGRKVTFAEKQTAIEDAQRAIDNAKLLAQQSIENAKINISNELHSWHTGLFNNKDSLKKMIVEARERNIFTNSFTKILKDMLNGEPLNEEQITSIQVIRMMLTSPNKSGLESSLSDMDKMTANVIIKFTDSPEYLSITQELINEGDLDIIHLMEVYKGEITPDEIDSLLTPESDYSNSQEDNCLLMGENGICQDGFNSDGEL